MASDLSPAQNERTPIRSKAGPRLTLLSAVAIARPLDDVASLVNLLNRTGESPSPGEEALRLAAVSRPVDEVRQLIALLAEPPHRGDGVDMALRAAAMGRPIEEVADLVASFGPDVRPPQQALTGATTEHQPSPTAAISEQQPAATNATNGPSAASATATDALQQAPTTAVGAPQYDLSSAPGAAVTAAPAANGTAVAALTAQASGRATSAPDAEAAPGVRAAPAMGSALRWPAAAALLVIASLHLPTDVAGLRSGGLASVVSLVICVLCLVLVGLLALGDTVWVWAAGAAAAVGSVAAHALTTGYRSGDVFQDCLGDMFAGATVLLVGCAAVTVVLTAVVPVRGRKSQPAVDDSSTVAEPLA